MHSPGADAVLVRHGELNVKSHSVQRYMERRLVENIEAILTDRDLPGSVEYEWSRPIIRTEPERVEAVARAGADAFGVVSTSPALAVEPNRAAILEALSRTAREQYDGGTFAVDVNRAHKDYPFTSQELERDGGSAIWEAVSGVFDPVVDLGDPDLTFSVEVRRDRAYVFLERIPGPRGLPLGTQAPMVALISGGIDSPVAIYETMRRGSPVHPVYVDLGDYGGPDHEARAVETIRVLNRYAPNHRMAIHRVPGGETVAHLAETMERGRMLSLRRFFYRVAEHVAADVGAVGIVTGEAIGQKSSQTARNLAVTSRATDLPIHRPLLSMDKQTIIDLAKEIGTFEESTIPAGCNRVAPNEVETAGEVDRLLESEPPDLFERAREAASAATVVEP